MTPSDAARLEVAKRAYRATQPTEREVQTGVRRARLSLRLRRSRSKWWLKGMVFVVLALGSLAYAKPHALSDLIEHGAPWRDGRASKGTASGAPASRAEEQKTAAFAAPVAAPKSAPSAAPTIDSTTDSTTTSTSTTAEKPKPRANTSAPRVAARAPRLPESETSNGSEPVAQAEPPSTEAPVSEWGRVGQALARGDEASALGALGKLARSDDPRTRDKADLGRAQLMMAHGNRDQACAIARSLTQRRSGSRIERQAQVLLKDCAR